MLSAYFSAATALALGFVVAIYIGSPYEKHVHKIISYLLKGSIVGLGFGLNLSEAVQAGKTGLVFTIASIITVLILGYFLGKIFSIDKRLSYLISVGTAICGGSAIAAVSPIVKSSNNQISVALALVFSLNAVALFIFPHIGYYFDLSQEQFGLWCAIGIHDTSSVVGAANEYGLEALKTATTIKLARALWIIPVSILTVFLFKAQGTKIKIPWFIGLFILAILSNTYLQIPDQIGSTITTFARIGLNMTLFLIGTTLSIKTIKSVGFKPLALGVILWLFISVASLIAILN